MKLFNPRGKRPFKLESRESTSEFLNFYITPLWLSSSVFFKGRSCRNHKILGIRAKVVLMKCTDYFHIQYKEVGTITSLSCESAYKA